MSEPNEPPGGNTGDASLKGLCRAGGFAAWFLFLYCLFTLAQLFVLGGQPATAKEAFDLLQQNRLVGLLRLDLPTVLALPAYYLAFLGLYVALRRGSPAGAVLATALAFVGVTLVLATPMGLSMVPLSDKYAAAASDEARRELLATGEAILATDMWHSTAAFVGGLLGQSGAVLVSVVMLRTRVFSRTTGWVGLVTHGLDLAHIALIPFVPGIGAFLMMAAGPLYLIWFPLVGRRLLELGRATAESGPVPVTSSVGPS